MKRFLAAVAFAAALVGPPTASAQTAPATPAAAEETPPQQIILFQRNSVNPSIYEFSFDPPDSPALPLIGVAADEITRVDSFHKLGLAIADDDDSGTAVAFDFSPFWAMGGEASLEDYSSWGRMQRAYARAEASIAFSEGNDTTGVPSSAVISFATSLLDQSDPGLLRPDGNGVLSSVFTRCIRGPGGPQDRLIALQDAVWRERAPADATDEELAAWVDGRDARLEARINEEIDDLQRRYNGCVEETSEVFRWRPALDVGIATRFVGEPGSLDDLESSGWILWGTYLTGAIGGGERDNARDGVRSFGDSLGLPKLRGVVHARYALDQVEFDENNARLGEADSASVVLGLEGGNERTRYSLQAGYTFTEEIPSVRDDVEQSRVVLRLDRRVGENIWLNAAVGHADGDVVEDDSFITIGFSFSAGEPSSVSSFFNDRSVGRRN